MVSFRESIKTCLTKKYFTVSGRATRAEYWWFQLFFDLVVWGPSLAILLLTDGGTKFMTIESIVVPLVVFYFLMSIPLFCVRIRRLHDVGFSGWSILLSLIPYVGGLIIFIMTLIKSDEDNKWGPNSHKQPIDNDLETQVVIEDITKEYNVSKTEIIL